MLVLKQSGATVIVLNEADLIALRSGPLAAASANVLFALSPDLAWTGAAFQEAEANGGLTKEKILSILATSIAKPKAGES